VSNSIDDRSLRALVEESSDLHADAMRDGRGQLGDYVEAAKESRFEQSRGLGKGALVAGAAGAAVLASAIPARAAGDMDTQILQTAASLEVVAIQTYTAALGLSFIGGSSANGVVKTFVQMTISQHKDHLQGFNSALKNLGSPEQNNPDPKYAAYVKKQLPSLKDAGKVVALAIALEDVAAQTYTKDVSQVSTSSLRQMFAGVAGVEAQHRAVLLAVQALIAGGAPQLIALPPDLTKLPKAAGSVGFPDSFYPTKSASPASEGAVK
jgi:hypothetical protein